MPMKAGLPKRVNRCLNRWGKTGKAYDEKRSKKGHIVPLRGKTWNNMPLRSSKLFAGFVAFLKNLWVDVSRTGSAAFRNVASDVKEFAFFLARRAGFGRCDRIQGVTAFVTFPHGHGDSSFFERQQRSKASKEPAVREAELV